MPTTTVTPPTPLIDWTTVGTIFQWSLIFVLAASLLYIIAVRSATAVTQRGGTRILGGLGILLSGTASATIVGWGLYLITAKG